MKVADTFMNVRLKTISKKVALYPGGRVTGFAPNSTVFDLPAYDVSVRLGFKCLFNI